MSSEHSASELAELFDTLDDERKASLFDYAEFLQSKGGLVKKEIGEPVDIPRPDEETVVGAVRRLRRPVTIWHKQQQTQPRPFMTPPRNRYSNT